MSLSSSSGGLNHVALGTFNSIFICPTRKADPWVVSMFIRTSFLGEGFPDEIVSQTSKPSTGLGCLESKFPPKGENKQTSNATEKNFSELQKSGHRTFSVQKTRPVVFGVLQYVKSVNVIYIHCKENTLQR